jgi:fructan beta-fructosidase
MSLPREVSLVSTDQGYRIRQRPVREAQALRGPRHAANDLAIGPDPMPLAEYGVAGAGLELVLDIELGEADRFILTLADDMGGATEIGVDRPARAVFVDRSRTGPGFHDAFPARHAAPAKLLDGRARLHVFVDRSIVEVFIDDGAETLTDLIFRAGEGLNWSARVTGGSATIRALEAWSLA